MIFRILLLYWFLFAKESCAWENNFSFYPCTCTTISKWGQINIVNCSFFWEKLNILRSNKFSVWLIWLLTMWNLLSILFYVNTAFICTQQYYFDYVPSAALFRNGSFEKHLRTSFPYLLPLDEKLKYGPRRLQSSSFPWRIRCMQILRLLHSLYYD